VRLEDLLGRHVRYKGEEGHVVEGHSDEGHGDQSSVVVSIRGASSVPRRNVTVPESEWGELELLP
jgi:ribosomal protein L35AE/L33A